VDATATLGVYVDISANFNMQTGVVTWVLTALDPTTLDLPSDPLLGLLPPDTNAPDGQGFVSYSVNPKAALVTGTKINAQATVIFDTNAPINTAPDYNTIDSGPPTSIVTALPATTSGPTFTVSWSGHDDAGGSGIASYSVYVSDNGGSYTPFQTNTTALSAPFTGEVGHTYSFYSVATDNVGNVQATPTAAQATTTVTAAVVSLSASTIATSPASIQAAGTDTVTLTARDTDGSLDTSGTLTVAFQVSSGPGGSFGQVTYEGNGTYTATFTAGDAVGTDTITGTIGGQSVTSTAPTVTVTPGAVSLSASTIAVSSPSILAGGTDTLTLTAVDAFGNLETGGGLTVAFQVNTGPGGTIGQVSYEGNGTYTATFTAGDTAGTDTIAATIGGQLVTSTPPTITVTVTSPPPPGSPPPPSSPPPPASPPLVAQPILVGGLPNGTVQVYTESNGTYTLQETLQPFGNIPTDVRTAVGDVNGDGIPDFIFAIGPSPTDSTGAAIPATATEFKVMVLSGAPGNPVLVQPFDPFLPNPGGSPFTAGGFVSVGDFLNNGRDQIVVSPDQQGGPRIAIYDMNGAATAGPQPATPVGVNTTEINPGSGLTRINNFLSVNATSAVEPERRSVTSTETGFLTWRSLRGLEEARRSWSSTGPRSPPPPGSPHRTT
jgi:hypothetical protein